MKGGELVNGQIWWAAIEDKSSQSTPRSCGGRGLLKVRAVGIRLSDIH